MFLLTVDFADFLLKKARLFSQVCHSHLYRKGWLTSDRVSEKNGARQDGLSYVQGFRLPSLDVTFCLCHRGCSIPESGRSFKIAACHEGCAAMIDEVPLHDMLKAVAFTSSPTPEQNRRRTVWLRANMIRDLGNVFYLLPTEMWWQIMSYCVREHSVKAMQTRFLEGSRLQQVSTAQHLWPEYRSFEGVSYLVSLTNVPVPEVEPLFRTNRRRVHGTFLVAEDYLGIRDIHFIQTPPLKPTLSSPGIDTVPGLWWRAVPTPPGLSRPRLTPKGNVSFYPGYKSSINLCGSRCLPYALWNFLRTLFSTTRPWPGRFQD